jgi:hypothetical protein
VARSRAKRDAATYALMLACYGLGCLAGAALDWPWFAAAFITAELGAASVCVLSGITIWTYYGPGPVRTWPQRVYSIPTLSFLLAGGTLASGVASGNTTSALVWAYAVVVAVMAVTMMWARHIEIKAIMRQAAEDAVRVRSDSTE